MTEVSYREGQFFREIVAQGHAGAGPYGEDLVCAAVSALMYTLAGRAKDRPAYYPEITLDEEHDLIRVRCLPDAGDASRCQEMFDTVRAGLRQIAERYPENVTYTENLWGRTET